MELFLRKKHAFLFQGVGSDYQKILDLLDGEQKERLKQYCDIVHKELDMDLWNYLFNSVATKYDNAFCDWIAIYTVDNMVYHEYVKFGIKPEVFLGYSMGLITAMTCGNSISFETGLRLLATIYEYPRYSSNQEEAMAVIIGMTYQDVDKIIQEHGLHNQVEIASENNEYCIVISGIKSGIAEVMTLAANEGALKVKEIYSPYAFHSRYATRGIEKFVELVEEIPVFDCPTPIVSSLTQEILQNSADLRKELIRNMPSRMLWKKSIEKIASMGIYSFIEVSLEDSLTKFSKLINMEYKFFTYNKFLKLKAETISSGEKLVG
jgi:malonyl CoA-acyl carrier protein transacylase